MKWLLAMLSKGRDVSDFFPDVVKNVVVKSVEVKKMVYIYLVHYADYDATCREIALLSINSFQKDMSGTNPLIRGLALRVMTSIRVPDVIQIQLLASRKCASDSSPYVRKCAATSLAKIYLLDAEQLPNLKQILDKLLKDSSTMVLGSAIATMNEICPECYDLIHRNYRKICHLLCDFDEWSQVRLIFLCSYGY
jgi:AP-3 complex subunit beta